MNIPGPQMGVMRALLFTCDEGCDEHMVDNFRCYHFTPPISCPLITPPCQAPLPPWQQEGEDGLLGQVVNCWSRKDDIHHIANWNFDNI